VNQQHDDQAKCRLHGRGPEAEADQQRELPRIRLFMFSSI
jgi:hypothetical protein